MEKRFETEMNIREGHGELQELEQIGRLGKS